MKKLKLSEAILAGLTVALPTTGTMFAPAHLRSSGQCEACAVGMALVGVGAINLDTGELTEEVQTLLIDRCDPKFDYEDAVKRVWPELSECGAIDTWVAGLRTQQRLHKRRGVARMLINEIIHVNDARLASPAEIAAELAVHGL